MSLTVLGIVFQLVFLEGILSIDNAAVLGAMVAALPDDRAIDWPGALQRFGELIAPFTGTQRVAALRVGLLGAYLGRGLMLVLASLVIQNPWLKLIGALYLVRLAFENLGAPEGADEGTARAAQAAQGFWWVVLNVELADLVFSLDNVVAAVSLSKDLWVVMLGVAIGILTMRFAAGLFARAVLKEPVLKYAAYLLVLNIGIQLLLEEVARVEIADWVRFLISAAIIGITLLYAHSKMLQRARPAIHWLAQGVTRINAAISWLLSGLTAGLRIIASPFVAVWEKAREDNS